MEETRWEKKYTRSWLMTLRICDEQHLCINPHTQLQMLTSLQLNLMHIRWYHTIEIICWHESLRGILWHTADFNLFLLKRFQWISTTLAQLNSSRNKSFCRDDEMAVKLKEFPLTYERWVDWWMQETSRDELTFTSSLSSPLPRATSHHSKR